MQKELEANYGQQENHRITTIPTRSVIAEILTWGKSSKRDIEETILYNAKIFDFDEVGSQPGETVGDHRDWIDKILGGTFQRNYLDRNSFRAIITIYETIVHTHVLWISFRASCASSGDLEPVTKTEQPWATRSLAVDRPIPLVDPVDELSYQQPTYPLRVSA
uniref:Uncharacterized protein n=1 Tax=Magallana gigas TaxID=29159 RepID=A0A8W8IPZ8_MAGGI